MLPHRRLAQTAFAALPKPACPAVYKKQNRAETLLHTRHGSRQGGLLQSGAAPGSPVAFPKASPAPPKRRKARHALISACPGIPKAGTGAPEAGGKHRPSLRFPAVPHRQGRSRSASAPSPAGPFFDAKMKKIPGNTLFSCPVLLQTAHKFGIMIDTKSVGNDPARFMRGSARKASGQGKGTCVCFNS